MFETDRFVASSRVILNTLMAVIADCVPSLKRETNVKVGDGTLVTETDKEVERLAAELIREHFPDYAITGEEGLQVPGAEIEILLDPLDGTRAFSVGAPTSTIIIGAVCLNDQETVGVAVAEPAYRRIWTAVRDGECLCWHFDRSRPCTTWNGNSGEGSTVFLDHNRGFRGKISDEAVGRLFTNLQFSTVQMYGSNGLHQALVADGRSGCVGSICLALGGPWDAVGSLLVQRAGGALRAYRIEGGELVSKNPLQPYTYDFLVVANNERSVALLSDALVDSLMDRSWIET